MGTWRCTYIGTRIIIATSVADRMTDRVGVSGKVPSNVISNR